MAHDVASISEQTAQLNQNPFQIKYVFQHRRVRIREGEVLHLIDPIARAVKDGLIRIHDVVHDAIENLIRTKIRGLLHLVQRIGRVLTLMLLYRDDPVVADEEVEIGYLKSMVLFQIYGFKNDE